MPVLPTDAKERKGLPIGTGVLDYFPKALLEVSKASIAGNNQFMPGERLHWDRSKSVDDADALIRHFLERGTLDSDGVRHSAKCAWRALAVERSAEMHDTHVESDTIMNNAVVSAYGAGRGCRELRTWPGCQMLMFRCIPLLAMLPSTLATPSRA